MLLNYDIVIPGLGWISISGKGLISLQVHVHENITPFIRNKPIMPYEIKAKGLKRYFGNTINSKSKINRKYTMDRYKTIKLTEEAIQDKKDKKDKLNNCLFHDALIILLVTIF